MLERDFASLTLAFFKGYKGAGKENFFNNQEHLLIVISYVLKV